MMGVDSMLTQLSQQWRIPCVENGPQNRMQRLTSLGAGFRILSRIDVDKKPY